ncbi:PAAR domain-containing protein [Caballeronia grimmiae]|uniref:PAAR domain-containing protein n=1 Tax=Caballeronia grimmiae TaxID=1071679 RepID=UPI0038BB7969
MSLPIIRVGDRTDHGGKVITGSSTHMISGRSVARLNDLVDCPQTYPDGRPHGINKIIEAHPTFMVGGQRVALHGHHSECGCALIGSTSAAIGA